MKKIKNLVRRKHLLPNPGTLTPRGKLCTFDVDKADSKSLERAQRFSREQSLVIATKGARRAMHQARHLAPIHLV
tara:strand:+ start:2471 stop:2695 length:225 start_codon:yes stop_codon:yes gene_type:complete